MSSAEKTFCLRSLGAGCPLGTTKTEYPKEHRAPQLVRIITASTAPSGEVARAISFSSKGKRRPAALPISNGTTTAHAIPARKEIKTYNTRRREALGIVKSSEIVFIL